LRSLGVGTLASRVTPGIGSAGVGRAVAAAAPIWPSRAGVVVFTVSVMAACLPRGWAGSGYRRSGLTLGRAAQDLEVVDNGGMRIEQGRPGHRDGRPGLGDRPERGLVQPAVHADLHVGAP